MALICFGAALAFCFRPTIRSHAQSATYTITDLGTLGGTESNAYSLDNCGRVVGLSTLATDSTHPFFWNNGQRTDVGSLAGGEGSAWAINAFGFVVGNSEVAPDQPHAFIWHDDNGNVLSDPGELKDLGGPPGAARRGELPVWR